ncbi:hypothetical protein GB937_010416, partial [Aspergillus fischeri]
MTGFRCFIRTQVALAQADLARLFLLHEEEVREEVVPPLALHALQDDPTNNQCGWNFLQDPRNRATLSTKAVAPAIRPSGTGSSPGKGGNRWLLDRVLQQDWLREEFLEVKMIGQSRQLLWHEGAVDQYLARAEEFLQRLLLLIHITGGQPARATELLSLRHSNTIHGRHRNIFIEQGLVSTVTTDHKGYSISNCTKIIHRYLPKPVSELVVYYLWLVLPLCQSLRKLVYGQKAAPSPFLWPATMRDRKGRKKEEEGSWGSDQLRKVLQREAQTHLRTKMHILSYRHAAIAISRVHLKCGGFKRDYGTDDAAFNEQASHGSWIAGTVYARGLQEAPGHVEARGRQYRAISREWNGFLGFDTYLGRRKRAWQGDLDTGLAKRPCLDLHRDPLPVRGPPPTFLAHLRTRHPSHAAASTHAARQAALAQMLKRPWVDARREACPVRPPGGLPVYHRAAAALTAPTSPARGWPLEPGPALPGAGQGPDPAAPRGPRGHRSPPPPLGKRGLKVPPTAAMTPAERIRAHVNQALQEGAAAAELANGQVPCLDAHPTEVSPWLELTRWPEYLRGQDLTAVALLGCPPDPVQEPLLAQFSASVERLIHQAYQTIRNGQINEFDQIQINTFFRQPAVWNRPIQIHLRLKTYRQYCQVWQRLVCFAYRSTGPDQPIQLRHQLNTAQLAALDRMEEYGQQLLALPPKGLETPQSSQAPQKAPHSSGALGTSHAAPQPLAPRPPLVPPALSPQGQEAQDQLDQACLALSIALLDHTLKGDLSDSTLVGFLAVLGVDPARQTFRDPYSYTSYLSGLVKMAQMLVALQAVHLTRTGEVGHPADALDEMRERFLLYGVRAPFGWITRLRTYGKKIQNSTTSLGYIYWSDDEQTLSYKDLQMSMRGFRQFIASQVELAQAALTQLLLLHEEEVQEEVVPQLALHELQDDPTNNQRGWNFLQDRRTRAALPTTGERWLLDRVLGADWLRGEFLQLRQIGQQDQVLWREGAVDRYLRQVKEFLERLLPLVHITGGQPARATELLSLRHSNTLHGRHRNIFIEHGLVSTVTTYHK